jgi:hypothetical protein
MKERPKLVGELGRRALLLNRYRGFAKWLFVLGLTGCGQVVKVKVPQPGSNPSDPNVNGTYVCTPAGEASFECKSGVAYFAYDREIDVGKQCKFGVANVYVATNWHGGVTKIQYACALARVTPFPTTPSPPPEGR